MVLHDDSPMEALNLALYRKAAATSYDHRLAAECVCSTIENCVLEAGVAVYHTLPFGSTVSGFSVEQDCDVDVCLVSGAHPSDLVLPPSRRYRKTLDRIRDALRAPPSTRDLVAILGARVPIIKFSLVLQDVGGVERAVPVDVCLNNLNGVRNTELQRQLACLEPRFRPLARLVKLWAKARGLVDASKHYFSSYALVLMVAGFLQQRGLLPKGEAFRTLAAGVVGFTPADSTQWIHEAPNPSADAPPPKLAGEVEALIRRVAAAEPGLNAKKVFAKVKEQLAASSGGSGGGGGGGGGVGGDAAPAAVTPKDVRAIMAALKAEETEAEEAKSGQAGADAAAGGGGGGGGARRSDECVAELLIAFFAHHADRAATASVVSLLQDGEPISKASKGWGRLARGRYSVEDPLEPEVDTARSLLESSVRVFRAEAGRAHRMLAAFAGGEAGDGDGAGGDEAAKGAAAGGENGGGSDAVLASLLRPLPRLPASRAACLRLLDAAGEALGGEAPPPPPHNASSGKPASLTEHVSAVRLLWAAHPSLEEAAEAAEAARIAAGGEEEVDDDDDDGEEGAEDADGHEVHDGDELEALEGEELGEARQGLLACIADCPQTTTTALA